MYTLYLLASVTTFIYFYRKIRNFLKIRNDKFEDFVVDDQDTKMDFLDITYEDNTREFLEDITNFDFILDMGKPIKYATLNYYTDDNSHSVLFNKNNLNKLVSYTFPFYKSIVKLPLYREVKKAVIFVNDFEYDITNILLEFAGPTLNYHSDIVKLRFEEIVDYSQEFPELHNVNGIINVEDNFGDKHIYNYPGEFTWEENLLNLKT
jgi:hypothetical protein